MPSDHQSIAAVVAAAADDSDGAGDAERFQRIGAASTGVFHQDEAGHSEFAPRGVVQRPHLLARQATVKH